MARMGAEAAMQDAPCALIVDDDSNSLGDVALRLLRLRIDVFYAKDPTEAWLLAQQEADRIQTLLFPLTVAMERISEIAACLRSKAPEVLRALVVVGQRPDETARERLRKECVEWALWEPYDESALRSIVSASMRPDFESGPRGEARLPTTLLARAFAGTRRRDAIVSTLSSVGAFLEAPSLFPEETRITLEIALPHGSLLVKARVVHTSYPNTEAPMAQPNGMGVEFMNLASAEEERLLGFLKEIEDQFLV